jgi:hypothetical protein
MKFNSSLKGTAANFTVGREFTSFALGRWHIIAERICIKVL